MDIRKLPIGIQSFEKLITGNYLYVDKTDYIYRLAHSGSQYFLSRPRRFGKSLLLSTLRAYWEGKKELFSGLMIEKLEEGNPEAWKAYPVFYFDFNRRNYKKTTALEEVLDDHLKDWEEKYGNTDKKLPLEARFQRLLVLAQKETGLRCVVLVDEYDKSLLEVMEDLELEEHNKAVFKGFFSTLKSFDQYLEFVMITGVTKFSKVSIFSDLNQLKDISMTSRYSAICGITEQELIDYFQPEIIAMAEECDMTYDECLYKLKDTYDGYLFHQKGKSVYNPYSLLNAFDDQEFRYYWFESGTPTFLVKRIKENAFDVRQFTDRTLYAPEPVLSDYRADNPNPVPLLYQTGYLTILSYDPQGAYYTLGFPNEEVKYGFLESLMPEYMENSGAGSGKDILTLKRYIDNGDLDNIKNVLMALFASIPYATVKPPYEQYFQTVIYLIFTLLGKYVHCEAHSSQGRADCIVETKDYVYLFEFKRDSTAAEALKQIEDRGYALPYAADQRKLYRIGVNFDSTKRILTEWKVEE